MLDIKIKKNTLKGWKGSVNSGYGTYSRYTGRLNANNIGKQRQNTVIASIRNTSDPISLNNASRNQLGGGANGNNDRREAGYTFAFRKEKVKLEGNLYYSGNHKNLLSDTRAEQIVSSGSYFTSSDALKMENRSENDVRPQTVIQCNRFGQLFRFGGGKLRLRPRGSGRLRRPSRHYENHHRQRAAPIQPPVELLPVSPTYPPL